MIELIPVNSETIQCYRLFDRVYDDCLSGYTSRIYPHDYERHEELVRQRQLYWRYIVYGDRYIGSVWIEKDAPADTTASLGIFIYDDCYRSKGLGREVIRLALADACHNLAIKEVALRVRADNTRALRCYRQCGFVPTDTFTKENGIEVIQMLKKLEDPAESA